MIKIVFICHGNICRSPMAEYIMKYLVDKAGLNENISISSAATSREAIGQDVHRGAREVLEKHNIPCPHRKAVRITREEYEGNDYVVLMENYNITSLRYLMGKLDTDRVFLLRDFSDNGGDIDDPWFTDEFEKTYDMIYDGCAGLLKDIIEKK